MMNTILRPSSGRYLGPVLGVMMLAGLLAGPAQGSAVIPPRDLGELAQMSDAVLLAKAGTSSAQARGGMIYTQTSFDVLDVVSGPLARGAALVVETYGGVLGDVGWTVGGSPHFAEETVYLLFLSRRGGVWQPRMMAYGLLERTAAPNGAVVLNHIEAQHDLELLPRPDGFVPEPIGAYYETRLLDHLRQVTAERRAWDGAAVAVPEALQPLAHGAASKAQAAPEPCVYFEFQGHQIRWNAFDEGRAVQVFAEENGDADLPDDDTEFTAVQNGIDAWATLPDVNVGYQWAGPAPYTPDCTDNSASPNDISPDQGLVQYNDPCDQIPDLNACSGVLAFGGTFFQGGGANRHVHREEEWNTTVVGYVVVNNGVGTCLTAEQYTIMMTHELGHTLAFDHIPFAAGPSIMNPTCCVDLSEIDQLCALYAYSDVALPGAPGPVTLLMPQDGAVDLPFTVDFSWEPDSASTAYYLQLGTDEDFGEIIYEEDALTETAHTVEALPDGLEVFWRVRGRNTVGDGPWSEVYRFTTQEEQFPPDSVVLVMPADSVINQPVTLTFAWEAAERASRYHLQVSADSAFSDPVYENDALIVTTKEVGPLERLTTYFWRVQATNSAGASPWSAVRRFKTVPPLPELIDPIAPIQDAVDISPSPELSWMPVALVEAYHLQVATTFNFSRIVYEVDTLTTTAHRFGPLETRKKYFWRVRGVNGAGGGPWMPRQRFTTGTPPGAVALAAPLDLAVDQPSTIRFEWRNATNATTYHLQISTDSSFAALVFEDEALPQTAHEVGPLAYLTTHFWRVRGLGTTGPGAWSPMRRFTVAIGTGVEHLGDAVPAQYALHANYPNPFNPQTTLRFDLPEAAAVSLVIYDVLGRAVETLVDEALPPGRFSFVWDAADRPSGVYLARLHAGTFTQTRQLLLLK